MNDKTFRLSFNFDTDQYKKVKTENQSLVQEMRQALLAANRLEDGIRDNNKALLGMSDRLDDVADELRRTERRTESFGRSVSGVARNALGAFAAALSVRELIQFGKASVDAAADLQEYNNSLRLVTESEQQLVDVRTQLFGVSQRSFNDFGATVDLYSRLARSTDELGVSQERLIDTTETINQLVALSGASAQGAQAALFQLGQGLGAGALRGEELNSVLEQTPELARAIARGLGVSIAELRELGSDGLLTAESVLEALESQGDATQAAFESLEPTFRQLQTQAENTKKVFLAEVGDGIIDELTPRLKEFNEILGSEESIEAARNLGKALGVVAGILADLVNLSAQFATNITNAATDALERSGERTESRDFLENAPSARTRIIESSTEAEELERIVSGLEQSIDRLDLRLKSKLGQNARESTKALRSEYVGLIEDIEERLLELKLVDPDDAFFVDLLSQMKDGADEVTESTKGTTEELEKQAKLLEEEAKLFADLASVIREVEFDQLSEGIESAFDDVSVNVRGADSARELRAIRNQAAVILEEQVAAIGEVFDEGNVEYGRLVKEANEEYERIVDDTLDRQERIFDNFTAQFERVTQGLLEDLIFNGGDNLGRILSSGFEGLINDSILRPISEGIFSENGFGFGELNGIFSDFGGKLSGIADKLGASPGLADNLGQFGALAGAGFTGAQTGFALGELFNSNPNQTNQVGGATAGAGIGAFFGGPVGALVGGLLGGIGGSLFGKGSDEAARRIFDADLGRSVFDFNKKNNAQNISASNSFADALAAVTSQFGDLTGADFTDQLRFSFGSRDGIQLFRDSGIAGNGGFTNSQRFFQGTDADRAFDEAVEFLVRSLEGGEERLVSFAKAAVASGDGFEEVLNDLQGLRNALDVVGDDEGLNAYLEAAIDAGREFEEIIPGLQNLSAVLDLNKDSLSNVARELETIDSAVNPVVEDLLSLGQSISEIANVGATAARGVGERFLERIQDDIRRDENATLASFQDLLDAQQQDIADAQLLLDRGIITEGEASTVAVRNSLQQTRFFDGLSQDQLNDLGDFLGLIRENGGELAAVLFELTDALDESTNGAKEYISGLREEGNRLLSVAQTSFDLRDDILRSLPTGTFSEQLSAGEGEINSLLARGRAGDEDALELLPRVASDLLALAERGFQGSGGLADVRDFLADALQENALLAEAFGQEQLDLADFAEREVDLLDQIKTTLQSEDPNVEILTGILNSGEIQNSLLADLLDQYVRLAFATPQNFAPEQVQAATSQVVNLPTDLVISNTVTTQDPVLAATMENVRLATEGMAERAAANSEEERNAILELAEQVQKLDQTLRTNNFGSTITV